MILPASLDTPAFRAAWNGWLAHRREIHHPVRPQGAEAAIARLAEVGADRACEVIRESVANGWRGLFPDRPAGGNGSQGKSQPVSAERIREIGRELERAHQAREAARAKP